METSNVFKSSRTVNSASIEERKSFNSPSDEDEIVVKGAFDSSVVTERVNSRTSPQPPLPVRTLRRPRAPSSALALLPPTAPALRT
jgi:hypothetical protein